MEIECSGVGIHNEDKKLDGIHNELRDLLYVQAKESKGNFRTRIKKKMS